MAGPTLNFEARRYSSDELVQMRKDLPVVRCIVANLNKHHDIAVILRIPKDAFYDPQCYCCKSETLCDLRNRRKISASSQRNVGRNSSEDSEEQVIMAADPTSGSQHVKWSLHPRESSDHSSQPHSAPTGIAAQQAENFRRFYRAVVSPTHIRVTAGGRIVPNTRAIGATQFEWNGEKQIFEPRKPSSEVEFKPLRVPPLLPTPAFAPGFPQLLPAGFLPSYNYVPHHSPQPPATMASQNLGNLGGNAHTPAPSGESAASTVHPANTAQPIKISHPSQFDRSKPFVFNGQLVYPIQPGHQLPPYTLPFPLTIMGNPNLGPSVLPPPAGFLIPQSLIPMGPSNDSSSSSLDHNPTLSTPNFNQGVENVASYNPYLPHPGQVSVPDITKFQIESFRNHLSFINDQLANTQHRIDVQYLEGQRADLMAIIEKMETMLTMQLAYGQKQNVGACLNGAVDFWLNSQPANSTTKGDARQMSGKNIGTPSCGMHKEESITSCGGIISARPSTQPTRSEEGHGTDGANTAERPSRLESTVSKSRLTQAAAKAPPFQPRTQAMVAANSFPGIASTSPANFTSIGARGHGEDRAINLDHAAYSPIIAGTSHATLSETPSTHTASIYTNNGGLPATFPGVHAINGQYTAPNDSTIPNISPAAVPYLVGTFPQGAHGNEVKVTDLQYPRPLTDEELRARFLYWGRAPRSAYGGLPKFDGKDFYPPSPAKESSRMCSGPHGPNTTDDRPLTPVALNFERLFDVPEITKYEIMSQESPSHLNVGTNPTPLFPQNPTVGFKSELPGLPSSGPKFSGSLGVSVDLQDPRSSKYESAIRPATDDGRGAIPLEDFSKLFLERDGSDSASPRSPALGVSRSNVDFGEEGNSKYTSPGKTKSDMDNKDDDDENESLDSWGAPKNYSQVVAESTEFVTRTKSGKGVDSHASPIAARLITDIEDEPPKIGREHSFPSRAESSSSSELHTLFLQNMLKSDAQIGMAAPALRTVSSATAWGYLPQYRGSAAASLAPAMLSISTSERDGERPSPRFQQPKRHSDDGLPVIVPGHLSENRPLERDQPPRPLVPTGDGLDAEGYMRYLAQKDRDKRITEHGWNANAAGSRHVMGSDWQ